MNDEHDDLPSWSPAAPARSGASSSRGCGTPAATSGCSAGAATRPEDGIEFVTGDLATGEGIDAAVEGAEIIVHCAGSAKGDEDKARNLVRAASRAGARHLVYISVVGADRIPVVSGIDRAMFGYFASKLAAEQVVAESGLPWTTLRATQFHDLILMRGAADGQAAGDTGPGRVPVPAGRRRRGGGPARRARARRRRPAWCPTWPGRACTRWPSWSAATCGRTASTGRSCRSCPRQGRPRVPGANLAPDRAVGRRTWEEFLAERRGPAPQRHDTPWGNKGRSGRPSDLGVWPAVVDEHGERSTLAR